MSSFLQSNREERFFCAVLLHVLLTPSASRDRALALINSASGGGLVTDDLECYVEVAALRDAWRLLGDPNKWTPRLYAARRDVLLGLLTVSCGYDGTADELDELMAQHAFFWSSPTKIKLVSPGRWPLPALEAATILGGSMNLKSLKWAFNSKPDLLLLSGGEGLIIEAKAASGFGTNQTTGFNQLRVQELISTLFPVVTRGLVSEPLRRIALTNHVAHGPLTWAALIDAVHPDELGGFTHAALLRASQVLS